MQEIVKQQLDAFMELMFTQRIPVIFKESLQGQLHMIAEEM